MSSPPPVFVAAPRLNSLAVAAFVCGLLGGIPIVWLLAVAFGLIALVQLRGSSDRGRGLAIAGLVLAGVWAVVIAVLAVVVTALGLRAPVPTRAELAPGQCFNYVRDGETLADMSLLPCHEPHRGEVTGSIQLPVEATISQSEFLAIEGCTERLNRYLRSPKPLIAVRYAGPSEREWAEGDRLIVCLARTKSETTTSLRD